MSRGALGRAGWQAALAAGLGALQTLAFVHTAWWPLPLAAVALLAVRLADATPARAFVLGWCFGTGWLLAGVWWLFISMHRYGGLPAPLAAAAVLALSAFLSLYLGAAAAVFVPESKGLNELLRDFRTNRNHLAIVIDEFGNTAGLLTIEDVLEEIVGEIEDEFDDEKRENGIYTLADGSHRVAGDVAIAAVNEAFATRYPEGDFDTIGGLVAHELGQVPRRGEMLELGGLRFTVMLTRGGAVRWFRVARLPKPEPAEGGDVD